MKNRKTTNILLLLLVLMNLVLLSIIWFKPASSQERQLREPRVKGMLKKQLDLDDGQARKVLALRKKHVEKAKKTYNQLREKKKSMMEAMTSENRDTAAINGIIKEIGAINIEIEKLLLEHYQNLEAVCTPEQQEKLRKEFRKFSRNGPQKKRSRH